MKLSIIIPIYNVEKYLAKCVDSVIDGDCSDYEIVLVNDGSPDGSAAIAQDYCERYPGLIRLISQANGGLGAARNTGLEAAQGEYLLFLDSDDTLAPGAVSEMLEALGDGPDVLIFDLVSVDETGRVLERIPGSPREGCFSLREEPALLFAPPNACGKLWKRCLFMDSGIRFPSRVWYEDLATTPKLLAEAGSIRSLRRSWYRYLLRPGSIMNSSSLERNREIVSAVDSVLAYFREKGLAEAYRQELEYMAIFHVLLTAGVRVSRIDPKSPVGDELLQAFLQRFPDYLANPYLARMPKKHRLLITLLEKRQRGAVKLLMDANDRLRR